MAQRADRSRFSENVAIRRYRLLAACLAIAIILPATAAAAPAADSRRVVPTQLHDRARDEGEVRVLVELVLPSGARTEGALSTQARSFYRQEIADTATRVLNRLAPHPHRVVRRYLTVPLIALPVGPTAPRRAGAAGLGTE